MNAMIYEYFMVTQALFCGNRSGLSLVDTHLARR